ncbi:MAG: 2,3-bisphosphoglycerate-independent phosphoglycerate mutase [Ignavibacteriales bacterium]|nr:2,3-bisphosphoglycerate-independent phosphoglycerate mutase [Ignavibacteriales bacterium]
MTLKLEKLKNFTPRKGPVLLVVMDGVGFGKQDESDGVYLAKTPNLDKILTLPNQTRLKAHGTAVGLPTDDDMGNSEVGHNALGAGRIFDQGAKLVDKSIASGEIFQTENWNKVIERGKAGGTVHFLGLLSDGNVHSHIKQLFTLINKCAESGVKKLRLHALLDGRDVPGRSAPTYITPTEELLKKISDEKGYDYNFGSGGGRMITTMDRYDADWDIVKRGWEAHVLGIGRKFKSASEAIETYYSESDKIDQYWDPFVIVDENEKPIGTIEDGDAVVVFNFRGDRVIEISKAFEYENFDKFDRVRVPKIFYAGMMEYDGDLHIPKNYLVNPPKIDRSISEYMCAEGLHTFAISETQKYGHVTYFWNGNKSGYVCKDKETYVEIPSDKIEFDKAPRMKADEITDKTIELLKSGKYQFGRINYPNGDMVGHTGVMEAVIKSVEAVDDGLAKLLPVIDEIGGIALITADHGNADEMFTEKNGVRTPKTSHTLNPVPFVIYDPNFKGEYKMAEIDTPGLTNIAGTILNLLGYENVEDYDKSLIEFI